ncbi:MAG: EVE domain-containing protein, partial [Gemmatimonadota bacterium]
MTRYWLFKTEPGSYSIDDLQRDRRTHWDSIRNYQARNFLRDEISTGDGVLFYHSQTDPPGVVGTAQVVRSGYPDPSARHPESNYFDPKASEEDPRWFMVDVEFRERLPRTVALAELKQTPGLESMVVGEREISGQVRRAYNDAQQHDHISPLLDRLFQSALRTSRVV